MCTFVLLCIEILSVLCDLESCNKACSTTWLSNHDEFCIDLTVLNIDNLDFCILLHFLGPATTLRTHSVCVHIRLPKIFCNKITMQWGTFATLGGSRLTR